MQFIVLVNKIIVVLGNRDKSVTKKQNDIDIQLKDVLKNKTNQQHDDAFKFFKAVQEIRDADVNDMTNDAFLFKYPKIKAFQIYDDVFLPDFNIDKEYVGHLLYYVLRDAPNFESVRTNLSMLNDQVPKGLNGSKNRLLATQKSSIQSEIKAKLKNMKFPKVFPDTEIFKDLKRIAQDKGLFEHI